MDDNLRMNIMFRFLTIIFTLLALIVPMFLIDLPIWSYVITLLALVFVMITSVLDRNYYLRFLNRSVFPTGLLVENKNDGQEKYTLVFPYDKNTKIVYWASKSGSFSNPKDAYGEYTNAGVAMTDENGVADFYLKEAPGKYVVPYKGQLMPHIHYRIVEKNGMLGEVKTYML